MGPFNSSKHPRGGGGRFSGDGQSGTSSGHPKRPGPTAQKRAHAVTPVKAVKARPAPEIPGFGGGLGAATSAFDMIGD